MKNNNEDVRCIQVFLHHIWVILIIFWKWYKMEQWFISIFGVCHYEKPGQIQIAVDSSAQCNDVLLTGTDLSNSLLGVLIQFHKQSFTITSDSNVFHISGYSCALFKCAFIYLFGQVLLLKYIFSLLIPPLEFSYKK